MFDEIMQDNELLALLRNQCGEEGISAEFDQQIKEDSYIILKLDAYYNSLKMKHTPPSADCLIIVKCDLNQGYNFYLIELRNTNSPDGFKIEKIKNKFQTVIEDFLTNRFGNIFLNNSYKINNLYLFFISDPYNKRRKNITDEEYDIFLNTRGLKLKALHLIKPFKFREKIAHIKTPLPDRICVTPC